MKLFYKSYYIDFMYLNNLRLCLDFVCVELPNKLIVLKHCTSKITCFLVHFMNDKGFREENVNLYFYAYINRQ